MGLKNLCLLSDYKISRCFSKVVSVKKKKTKNSHAVLLAVAPNKAGKVKAGSIRAEDPRWWPHTRCSNPLWMLQQSRTLSIQATHSRQSSLYCMWEPSQSPSGGSRFPFKHWYTGKQWQQGNKPTYKGQIGHPCRVCTEWLEAVLGPRKKHMAM